MLAKQVSDYTKETFFAVMQLPALEVAGVASLMKMEAEYHKLK